MKKYSIGDQMQFQINFYMEEGRPYHSFAYKTNRTLEFVIANEDGSNEIVVDSINLQDSEHTMYSNAQSITLTNENTQGYGKKLFRLYIKWLENNLNVKELLEEIPFQLIEKIEIKVQKQWQDGNKKVSKIRLLRDGNTVEGMQDLVLSQANGWKDSFKHLLKKNEENQKDYMYTIMDLTSNEGEVEILGDVVNGFMIVVKGREENKTTIPLLQEVTMHRLYNPNSGEHFYTRDLSEKQHLLHAGWKYEGDAWVTFSKTNLPIYCLYNENGGEHHYTKDKHEVETLMCLGWKGEGISFYSLENGVAIYRLYNSNAYSNNHHYTSNMDEVNALIRLGWKEEGIAWYTHK